MYTKLSISFSIQIGQMRHRYRNLGFKDIWMIRNVNYEYDYETMEWEYFDIRYIEWR